MMGWAGKRQMRLRQERLKKENEEKAEKYDKLRAHCRKMFREAQQQGLYLGIGKDAGLPNTKDAQEGPLIKQLRKLTGM